MELGEAAGEEAGCAAGVGPVPVPLPERGAEAAGDGCAADVGVAAAGVAAGGVVAAGAGGGDGAVGGGAGWPDPVGVAVGWTMDGDCPVVVEVPVCGAWLAAPVGGDEAGAAPVFAAACGPETVGA